MPKSKTIVCQLLMRMVKPAQYLLLLAIFLRWLPLQMSHRWDQNKLKKLIVLFLTVQEIPR